MANLTTLNEYKDAEGISTPKDDQRIISLVTSVSQLVKTYCANSIVDYYSTNKTEVINVNWDTDVIQLTESPVNTIVSVEERASYQDSYVTLTEAAYEFYFDGDRKSVV